MLLRSFRHWTPSYILNRLNLIGYQRRHPDAPWLDKSMIAVLQSWLRPQDRGLEWGSGRSTIWFARRVASLTSIEHDPVWYVRVSEQLKLHGLCNVQIQLCQDETEYWSIAQRLPISSVDFCLVDGILRDRCALTAVPLIKAGGILVVDNCNWYIPNNSRAPFSRRFQDGPFSEEWVQFLSQVKSWRSIWTSNGVFDACLWVKP